MEMKAKIPGTTCALLIGAMIIAGCQTANDRYGFQTTGLTGFTGADQSERLASANKKCWALFNDADLSLLKGKMVLTLDQTPTRAMIALNEGPTGDEMKALQRLEGVRRTCDKLKTDAGHRTTAGEDIMRARLSKLRFGLYKGEIPYAVYNYGFAQAMKEQAQFQFMADQAYAQGQEIGRQRLAENLQQMHLQSQMTTLQNQINRFNTSGIGGWNCSTTHLAGASYSVRCF